MGDQKRRKNAITWPILALTLALSGCGKSEENSARMDPGITRTADVIISQKTFTERTQILLDLLDQDLSSARGARAARLKFFKAITPAVVEAMLEVEMERETVFEYERALKNGAEIPSTLEAKISALLKRYKTKDTHDLSKRIDFVPIDMLFTQASVESARGESPVAKDCHNIFGVHAANEAQRCPGHPILAIYPDFTGSIKRYVLLLNSGSAFKPFRETRAKLRASVGERGPLDSSVLVEGLLPYSERGEAYLRDISALILTDHLDALYREFMSKSE